MPDVPWWLGVISALYIYWVPAAAAGTVWLYPRVALRWVLLFEASLVVLVAGCFLLWPEFPVVYRVRWKWD